MAEAISSQETSTNTTAASIIQLFNCKGIQIGENNKFVITKEANEAIKGGSSEDISQLSKNQVGVLLVKRCIQSTHLDTLAYEELSEQLRSHVKDIKDEKLKSFKDIAGFPLSDFLTRNREHFVVSKRKGKSFVKLKVIKDTVKRNSKTGSSEADGQTSKKELSEETLSLKDCKNKPDSEKEKQVSTLNKGGELSENWTKVVKGKKKSKRLFSVPLPPKEQFEAKEIVSECPKQDIDVEKFKTLLKKPADRDHIFIPNINIYQNNRLKFMLDIVSLWNTPQRTTSFIVLGVKESFDLPHTLVSLENDIDDEYFQTLFNDGYFTMRPRFKYRSIRYLDGSFGFIEIQSSYGYGQPCIVKKESSQDDINIKENEMWFREGTVNTVCEPIDNTTVSIYQWFAGASISQSTNAAILDTATETHVKNAGTSTNEFEGDKTSSEKNTGETLEYFWEQVHSFQKGRFVLVSGDVQNKHRHLEALSLIPWIAVYDFNIRSGTDGLLNAVKDSIERKRSLHITTWKEASQSLSEQATCWCFMRGRREISDSRTDEKKGDIEDTASWFKIARRGIDACCEQLAFFSEEYTVITMVIIWPENERLIPILQKFIGKVNEYLYIPPKHVVILCNELMTEKSRSRFTTFCDDYAKNTAVCKIAIGTVCSGVMKLIKRDNPARSTFSLPTADGSNDLSISDKDAAWLKEDIDVLYIDNPYSTVNAKEIQDAIDSFYRGVTLPWRIRYESTGCQADIERDKTQQLEEMLKTGIDNYKTVVITLYHSPGSGGTTLAQAVLWKFHTKNPCVHLKVRSATSIDELCRRVAFLNKKTQLPIIMLIDGEEESKVLYLSKRLLYAIIIYVKRYPYKVQKDINGSQLFLEGLVSPKEASKLSAKFGQNCDDTKKKALERLNQDVQENRQVHHLYEFGLTRFHHEFQGIVSFVQGYLQLQLNPTEELLSWQRCLGYLALVYYYGQASVPCQFFTKLMNMPANYSLTLEDFPYEFTQFVTYDINLGKKDCIRICHQLVAKEILEQILERHSGFKCHRTDKLGKVASKNLSKFAIEFIEYAGGKKTRSSTQTSTIKFILTKTFIFREDRDLEENDEQKKKRPQLSRLLIDIPSDKPLFTERLRVLEKLTSSFPDDPNFFAHLGRFYAFCRPDDDALADKFSRKAIDLCQKQIEGRSLDCIDDSMRQTLMHVYHMYAHIKRRAISRYTGWSENDKAQFSIKVDQISERFETLVHEAEIACLYYKKSREATPETHCPYVYAYTDEIKVRLQICEFVKKQLWKQGSDEAITAYFELHTSKDVKAFITRSVHVIENLIMECYMDLELLNEEIRSLQHLVMWYNTLFKGNTITPKTVSQPSGDDISDRCLQIALIKLKYGTRSTFGNMQNITDADDVNKTVQLLEEIFEQTQRYGFTNTYGKHELERDFRDWIYAIRHDYFRKVYDIESVLSTLQLWQDKTNSPLSRYYIFIMKSLLGFGSHEEQGKTVCLMEAETYKEELIKMKLLIIRPKYPREWLGKNGKGIKRLLPGKRFIGNSGSFGENEAMSTHVQPSTLAICTGTILAPNTNRIGSYIAYDLGVNTVKVFFIPKRANLEGSRYVGHRVEFNLAFSIELGYEAYNVFPLKTYGCSNCSANLEFTSDITMQNCRCGSLVYKDELNETHNQP